MNVGDKVKVRDDCSIHQNEKGIIMATHEGPFPYSVKFTRGSYYFFSDEELIKLSFFNRGAV